MLTNIKSESNAPFLKSPPLGLWRTKLYFSEKSSHLCQNWVLTRLARAPLEIW